jgi:hypothetical protein
MFVNMFAPALGTEFEARGYPELVAGARGEGASGRAGE